MRVLREKVSKKSKDTARRATSKSSSRSKTNKNDIKNASTNTGRNSAMIITMLVLAGYAIFSEELFSVYFKSSSFLDYYSSSSSKMNTPTTNTNNQTNHSSSSASSASSWFNLSSYTSTIRGGSANGSSSSSSSSIRNTNTNTTMTTPLVQIPNIYEDQTGHFNPVTGELVVHANETYISRTKLCGLMTAMTNSQLHTKNLTTRNSDNTITKPNNWFGRKQHQSQQQQQRPIGMELSVPELEAFAEFATATNRSEENDRHHRQQLVPSLLTVNITMNCTWHKLYKGGTGEGNWVTYLYASRMAAYLYGINFKFQCTDQHASIMQLLLPWFDTLQPAYANNNVHNYTYLNDKYNASASNGGGSRTTMVWPYTNGAATASPYVPPSVGAACTDRYPELRLDYMSTQIQTDLRKMAVLLLGTRDRNGKVLTEQEQHAKTNNKNHHDNNATELWWSHPSIPIETPPIIPNIELDEAMIHFRCGDVMGGANRHDFGMIKFNAYKVIPATTHTIGIATQPFEPHLLRGQDRRKAGLCKDVAYALVHYLQEHVAPNATITIRNSINETLPLTYARLVMAKISITSLSSFGIFPVVGTFGQGYFQQGNRGVNPFATHIPKILPNIHEMNGAKWSTGSMRGKNSSQLIEWFTTD